LVAVSVVSRVSCYHVMARSQGSDGGDGFQIGRVNEQARTADKGLYSLVDRDSLLPKNTCYNMSLTECNSGTVQKLPFWSEYYD